QLRVVGEHPARSGDVRGMPARVRQTRQTDEHIDGRSGGWNRRGTPDERRDVGEMLFELRPARKSIRSRDDELRVGQSKSADGPGRARMELAHLGKRIGIARAHRVMQSFGLFPEVIERRVVRQRTDWHSDLLARSSRAGGLWSAASGEEALACVRCNRRAGLALSADWMRPGARFHYKRSFIEGGSP